MGGKTPHTSTKSLLADYELHLQAYGTCQRGCHKALAMHAPQSFVSGSFSSWLCLKLLKKRERKKVLFQVLKKFLI